MNELKLWYIAIESYGYDSYDGHVIWASSEESAREFAAQQAADEGAECWRDPKQSACVEVKQPITAGILLSSFNAG